MKMPAATEQTTPRLASTAATASCPKAARWLWYMGMLFFPVTTAAFLPLPTLVKPPTALLCAMALILSCTAVLRLCGERHIWLLGSFAAIGIGAALISLPDLMPLKHVAPWLAMGKGVLSLALGAGIYLATRAIAADPDVRRNGERMLYLAMAAIVVAVAIQVLATSGAIWAHDAALWMARHITGTHAAESWLQGGRAWGLALEPSWLASTCCVLIIPLALSTALTRPGRLSAMVATTAALIVGLSTARSGAAQLIAIASVAFGWLLFDRSHKPWRRLRDASIVMLVLIASLALSLRSPYARTVVNEIVCDQPAPSAQSYPHQALQRTGTHFRIACWEAAWRSFLEKPLMGWGLGLAAWPMIESFPGWAMQMPANGEAAATLDRSAGPLPNPKNMPLRLLAETGVLGFAAFAVFSLLHFLGLWRADRRILLMGILVGVTLVLDGLSLDSFALPAPWIALAWLALPHGQVDDAPDPERNTAT